MLDHHEVMALCQRLGLPGEAQTYIERVQSAPPSRQLKSTAKSVKVRYPSRKMRCVIQARSHRISFPGILELEYDDTVLAYYDQPPAIKLTYPSANGRPTGAYYTPDFFVIRSDSVGWEEWQTEKTLQHRAAKMPNRYVQSEAGRWRCLPGEAFAQPFGFTYRVRSTATINWIFQRNAEFLADYLAEDCPPVAAVTAEAILAVLRTTPGSPLLELIQATAGVATVDDIYTLVATGQIYIDLQHKLLTEPEQAPVFPDKATARAHAFITETADKLAPAPGDLPPALSQAAQDILQRASPEDLSEANRRYQIILPELQGIATMDTGTPARTRRRWKEKFRLAERLYGCGYLGLIQAARQRGNRTAKLPPETKALQDEFIEDQYETLKQKNKRVVYGQLLLECEKRSLIAPSYATFCQAVRQRPIHQQVQKRKGSRAAYDFEPMYWELHLATPRHGEWPFQIVHIDHTELDVEIVSARTGRNLGRPWVTFLVDAFSRRILALYLTFDSPSYRACMMVLRECVRRHGRLPQTVIVDGGPEFRSTYFETLLARYGVTKKERPKGKARFGAVIERLFGTTNTQFVHNLAGNTQLTQEARLVTRSVNPKEQAVWTFATLSKRLKEYCYELYDTNEQAALGQSPREAFAAGLTFSGERPHRRIAYDEDFRITTLPTTQQASAKVYPNRGIKLFYIYYWHPSFRHPDVAGHQVPLRYDPDDIGVAYAFVQGQWVKCISEYYAQLHCRSEKERKLVTAELRQQRRRYGQHFSITAKKIAAFLNQVEADEALLLQRERDAEARAAFQSVSATPMADPPPVGVISPNSQARAQSLELDEPPYGGDKLQTYGDF